MKIATRFNYLRFLLPGLLGLLLATSCKKNAGDEMTNADPQVNLTKGMPANAVTGGRLNDREIQYLKEKFATPQSQVASIRQVGNIPDGYPGPVCCADFDQSYCTLYDVKWVNCGTADGVKAIYRWTVYEKVCSTSPGIDYTFTVQTNWGFYTGSAVLIDSYFFTLDYVCCRPSQYYCAKTFEVTIQMTEIEFSGVSSSTNTVTGSSACLTPPHAIAVQCPLTIYYTAYPARIFVNNYLSGISVTTECALLCDWPPHTGCPAGPPSIGVFEYKVQGSSAAPVSQALTSHFTIINPIASNLPGQQYEYRCRLYYGGYSTETATGTFIIP